MSSIGTPDSRVSRVHNLQMFVWLGLWHASSLQFYDMTSGLVSYFVGDASVAFQSQIVVEVSFSTEGTYQFRLTMCIVDVEIKAKVNEQDKQRGKVNFIILLSG